MPNNTHIGKQNSRDKRRLRWRNIQVKYVIVTDGEKTEENYFNGLKEALLNNETPISLKIERVVNANKLIEKCNIVRSENDLFSDYNPTKIWIVFDRDRVENFDEIIQQSRKNNYEAGWSNPCIEEWFWAYFEELGSHFDSVTTNSYFKVLFNTKTERKYKKNLPDIYDILRTNGDEKEAIQRAENKLKKYESDGITTPSKMYSATTVYKLVKEWRDLEKKIQ